MTPTNFKEYLDLYIGETVVRNLFPRKDMTIEDGEWYTKEYINNNTMNVRKYQANCIDCGYETHEIDKPNRSYNSEKSFAFSQIVATEDNLLFHGCKSLGLEGLDKCAKTVITGTLQSNEEKYHPNLIVANRTSLRNIKTNTPLKECQFIENGVYYFFPEITPDIAEFVVWKDVYEDPEPFRQLGGKNIYDIREWVAIAIHEPKKFIKVI